MTPDLRGSAGTYLAVRAYYSIVETIGRLIPSVTGWTEVEMGIVFPLRRGPCRSALGPQHGPVQPRCVGSNPTFPEHYHFS